uniref:Cytochrome c oxidase assembly protein COX16 homolog, mitochondrial n=1 Tax=Oryctolagus cuniculus TaxID=9986 RepID=A0A5F9CBK6_RABIT
MLAPVVMRTLQEQDPSEWSSHAVVIVGGSFGLHELLQIQYDSKIDPELEKKKNLKMNKVSLESEYEKIKDSTLDDSRTQALGRS